MSGRFFTITSQGTGEYKEKGSKFLAFAFHVKNEGEVKEKLSELRKKYYDARHHCYAFSIGMENRITRANDDGEPNHSAGDPILGQIQSLELTDVLVVVLRYFGGTKLGVGGLVTAYKMVARHALDASSIMEIFPMVDLELKFPYSQLGYVERLLGDIGADVGLRDFQTSCTIAFSLKKSDLKRIEQSIIDFPTIDLIYDSQ